MPRPSDWQVQLISGAEVRKEPAKRVWVAKDEMALRKGIRAKPAGRWAAG